MSYRLAAPLGTAHLTWAVILMAGGASSVIQWLTTASSENVGTLMTGGWLVFLAGSAYLALSAVAHFGMGRVLRRGAASRRGGTALLLPGNLIVAIAALAVLSLGPSSRTLLASLDWFVAVLATGGVMSSILLLITVATCRQRLIEPTEAGSHEIGPQGAARSGMCWMLHVLAAAAVAICIFYLERLPLPGASL
jgi:hypothetical protein